MFNFLRKLRQKEFNGRYFKYAIGEIILVVIGILIALQVNNFNEQNKENQKEQELLSLLKIDLESLLEELNSDLINAQYLINVTDSILLYNPLKSNKPIADFFVPNEDGLWALTDVKLYPSKATYETIKSIGIELIKDSDLRLKIIDLYERKIARVNLWENLVYDYEHRLLKIAEQHMVRKFGKSVNLDPYFVPKDYKSFSELKEFNNALAIYQDRRRFTVARYENVKLLTTDIIKTLDNYITKL